MLIRLLPDQVSDNWGFLSPQIEKALPSITSSGIERMNNILISISSEEMDCWTLVIDDGVLAVVTTMIIQDPATRLNNFLIYSLTSLENFERKLWVSSVVTLMKYAKSRKCINMVAYSNVSSVVNFVKQLGGDTSYTFLSIGL